MSGHQRIAISEMTAEQARAIFDPRYAAMIEGSHVVVEYHPPKSTGDGWHCVMRVWPDGRQLQIGHARARGVAESTAAEWRVLDFFAAMEAEDQPKLAKAA